MLCIENGINWIPVSERPLVWQTLRGARRELGDFTNRKLGITLEHLTKMRGTLNFQDHNDITFWAACLVGFYGLFRKANLCVKRAEDFNPRKDLRRGDLLTKNNRLIIQVRHSKVIQFGERVLEVMMPYIPGKPELCPTVTVAHMIRAIPTQSHEDALFQWRDKKGKWTPLTHNILVGKLKASLQAVGVNPTQYSGHSFRRGGATWAHSIGVSDKLIKTQGDWASDAYMIYITIGDAAKMNMVNTMASAAARGEIGGP